MKLVVHGTAGGMNPVLTSKHGAYDHFTHKEKVQNRKLANSDATLVGVVNWVTANPRTFSPPKSNLRNS